jgi:autotransporter-associated beta strand protein
MGMRKSIILCGASTATMLLTNTAVRAAVTFDTWTDASGTDNNFGTAANWLANTAPNTTVNTQLFNSTPANGLTVNIAVNNTVMLNTEFNTSAGSFTFTGNTIDFDSSGSSLFNIDASVTGTPTITVGNNIQAWGAGTFTTNSSRSIQFVNARTGASLILNGNLTGGATAGISEGAVFYAGNTGASAATGSITVNGVIADGTSGGNLYIAKGSGTQGSLFLNGPNTYSGGTEYGSNSAMLSLGNATALGTGALRLLEPASGGSLVASTPLTGANKVANTINFVSNTVGTATTSNAVVALTAGSNLGTLSSGIAPAVGDYVTAGNGTLLPKYVRVTGVSGSNITFDVNAVATGTSGALTTKPYSTSGSSTLTIGGSNDIEFSGTQNLSTVWSNNGAVTQTYNITNAGTTTFSGVLEQQDGVASIIKAGIGKLVLSNANTYTGTTNVSAGVLSLLNTAGSATGSGAFNVTPVSTLAIVTGTGISTGLLTLNDTLGRLAPGANTSGTNKDFGAAGTLSLGTTGGMTLTNGNLDFDLDTTPGGTNDLIQTGGTLALGTDVFTFNELNGSFATGTPYPLISGFTNTLTIPGTVTGTVVQGGYTASFSQVGTSLDVTFTAVPEPAGLGLIGVAGMLLGRRRRPKHAE